MTVPPPCAFSTTSRTSRAPSRASVCTVRPLCTAPTFGSIRPVPPAKRTVSAARSPMKQAALSAVNSWIVGTVGPWPGGFWMGAGGRAGSTDGARLARGLLAVGGLHDGSCVSRPP
ncbi:MAG: hypothetical protein ACK52I_20545 [Pseudomonadota bacterium]